MDELIGEFITETSDNLTSLDQGLVALEKNPEDEEILGQVFRVMHTIKGTCGFLGLSRLEHVAHAAENLLGKFRAKEMQPSPEAVTLILQSIDAIKKITDHIANEGSEPEGEDNALVESLSNYIIKHSQGIGEVAVEITPIGIDNPIVYVAHNDSPPVSTLPDPLNPQANTPAPVIAVPAAPVAAPVQAAAAPAVATPTPVQAAPAPVVTDSVEALLKAIPVMPQAPEPAKSNLPAKAPEVAETKNSEVASAAQSIRVNLNVLERMMQVVGELVLSRNQLLQIANKFQDADFASSLQHLSYITSELQENVMKTRMQPIGNAWAKFPRLIRDLSIELNKKIELSMEGGDTELDRQLLEAIKDPLTHMVRNSCDHGIERPEERKAKGKSEHGMIKLRAFHESGHIVIEIRDDGRGANIERIKEKAVTQKLATAEQLANMSDRQILQFIFLPGFSTAEKVTSVSGRGVGMDVVKTNIATIGGTIDMNTDQGRGMIISIKIPLTLAIVSALIVEVQGEKFALPQINVRELISVDENSSVKLERVNNSMVVRLRGKLLPVVPLADVFKKSVENDYSKRGFIVVCHSGETDIGIMVDRIYNIDEIVVKPVSRAVKSAKLFAGNTILGDGSVIMILDPVSLTSLIGTQDLREHKAQQLEDSNKEEEEARKLSSFLLFSYKNNAPKAIPLELVWRLEEVDTSKIEKVADGKHVIQYRDHLMLLLTVDPEFPTNLPRKMPTIVFSYDEKVFGLLVDNILDIVHIPYELLIAAQDDIHHGSTIISGHTTDIVNVAHLLSAYLNPTDTGEGISRKGEGSVLFVDDSPFFRSMIVPFLNQAGYKVATAGGAIEALAMLEQSPAAFDVIITDIQMPGMNGYSFAETAHSFPDLSRIPIIGFTASAELANNSHNYKSVTKCILKNNRIELLDTIATLMQKKIK